LNSSSRGADDLKVLWADGERVFCRGESDGDGAGVLVVRPAAEHPSLATLDRLAHEYELRDELDAAWRWCEPILDGWQTSGEMPRPYSAGSWGPAASSALVGRDGAAWREES